MNENGYIFTRDQFVQMLARKWFPERTDRESRVLLAFLSRHHQDYDEIRFSVRVGEGLAPDPTHLPAVQQNTAFSTKKRIDCLARSGSHWTIIEVKERVSPASLGQIRTYRHLWLTEHPDAEDPELVVCGAFSDPDTIRALTADGITIYLYPPEESPGPDADRDRRSDAGSPP